MAIKILIIVIGFGWLTTAFVTMSELLVVPAMTLIFLGLGWKGGLS